MKTKDLAFLWQLTTDPRSATTSVLGDVFKRCVCLTSTQLKYACRM